MPTKPPRRTRERILATAPRAVQPRGRAERDDGRHRRRDEHQPGQPLLSLPQQGRHHRRALRGARELAAAAARRRLPPARRRSRTCGCSCISCSSGWANTASSIATSTRSRRATAASRCASPPSRATARPPCARSAEGLVRGRRDAGDASASVAALARNVALVATYWMSFQRIGRPGARAATMRARPGRRGVPGAVADRAVPRGRRARALVEQLAEDYL